MKLTDTHCHLNAETFSQRWETVWQEANTNGVKECFVVGWHQASSLQAVEMAKQQANIKAVIGLHPVDVVGQEDLNWILDLYHQNTSTIVAIGEIGLDYYWKKSLDERHNQKVFFIKQIAIANELGLPIVVHCRDAYEDTLDLLKLNPPVYGGVMHCYGGPHHLIPEFVKLGMYFSYGGPVTFKNANEARLSLLATPLDRLLIETDSPYLAPTPFRGQENTPSKLIIVFDTIQKLLNLEATTLATQLEQNKQKLFHVKTK
jgi:TatD DNase family protein